VAALDLLRERARRGAALAGDPLRRGGAVALGGGQREVLGRAGRIGAQAREEASGRAGASGRSRGA
jgi:hypothetical protein